MKTFDLTETEHTPFIYLYGVEGACRKSGDRIKILDWKDDNKLDFEVGVHSVYFKTEQDRLMFLLWWGNE